MFRVSEGYEGRKAHEMCHRYQEIVVWQKAKSFAGDVYRVTNNFPRSEIYGLTSQPRRAAVSVASNIAEGQGRLTKGEFCNFLGQARGSLLELETQLAISLDLHFLSDEEFKKLGDKSYEVLRMLNGLIESLRLRKTGS